MSINTPRTELSSPPGQEDQSVRLAASAQVDQVGDTITFKDLLPALTEFGIAALYGYALGLALVLWTLKEVGA